MADLTGRQIGDYKLVELIGSGGQGQVYLAENVHHKKRYALKVLPDTLSRDKNFRQRFFTEARVMSELDHQHIVRVHHMGEFQGIYYLVMDYIKGVSGKPCSLHELLKNAPAHRIDEKTATLYFMQIAQGLGYAHKKGVIHRDIKPANILIAEDGSIKITDFGLAKAFGDEYIQSQVRRTMVSLGEQPTQLRPDYGLKKVEDTLDMENTHGQTTSSTGMGTYGYMSPEQLEGGHIVDQRSDIYSFGVLIYRMLTSRMPMGFTEMPSKVVPGLSPIWDTIIRKCLHNEPKERFDSIESLLLSFNQYFLQRKHENLFLQIQRNPTLILCEQYIRDYPTGLHIKEINKIIDNLKQENLFQQILKNPTDALCEQYLKRYPEGLHRNKVGEILEQLEEAGRSHFLSKFLWLVFISIAIMAVVFYFTRKPQEINKQSPPPVDRPPVQTPVTKPPAPAVKEPKQPPRPAASIINSLNMKLVYVEAGDFMMGSPNSDPDKTNDESPMHNVEITVGFYIGEAEVTQSQWFSIMGTTLKQQRDKVFSSLALSGEGPDFPMYYVSWEEASEFCVKLSEKEGRHYRLPTEAEWEYASRAGTGSERFFFGNDESKLSEYAWFNDNSQGTSHPIGQKKPNKLGLYDMYGNVREWCSDWYAQYSGGRSINPEGPVTGTEHSIRGGCWASYSGGCRSAIRDSDTPDNRSLYTGFRIVLEEDVSSN